MVKIGNNWLRNMWTIPKPRLFQMAAFMTLNKEQSEEMPNDNEKVLQHYIEKMGDLIAVSDEGVSSVLWYYRQLYRAH